MTGQVVRTGGCLCGAVRYEVRGEPFKSGLCHCGDCRKVTGSAFLAYADWLLDQFSYSGAVISFHKRCFCPICGGRVFSLNDRQAEIYLGSLDHAPDDIEPDREIWVKRREHWLPLLPIPQDIEDAPNTL